MKKEEDDAEKDAGLTVVAETLQDKTQYDLDDSEFTKGDLKKTKPAAKKKKNEESKYRPASTPQVLSIVNKISHVAKDFVYDPQIKNCHG